MLHLNLAGSPAEEWHPADLSLPSHLQATGGLTGCQYPGDNKSEVIRVPASIEPIEIRDRDGLAEAEPKEGAKGSKHELARPRRWNRSRVGTG